MREPSFSLLRLGRTVAAPITVVILALGILAGGLALAQSGGDVYTGCINPGGNLVNVAIGGEPAHPGCNANARQMPPQGRSLPALSAPR